MSEFPWLNKPAKIFLQNGYLTSGVSPEQRIENIAKTFGERKGKKLGEKFLEYSKKGWFLYSSPVWANYGTPRGLPISCLTGDSWINTLHEGGTLIKDIKIGDKVLTHKGRFRRVTNVQVRDSQDDIFEIKVQTRKTPIKITGNHPVLTNLGWVRVDELNPKIHYIATNNKVELFQNSEYPILLFNNKKDHGNGKFEAKKIEQVKVDKDLAWAIGLWFAEGSLSINQNKTPNGIRITMGIPFKNEMERFGRIIENKTGLPFNIYESSVERNGKTNSWLTLNINSVVLGEFFLDNFGKNCKVKNIPQYIKEAPIDIISSFFEGFYLGDGCKTYKQQSFTISNPKLAMSLYEIGLRCGYRMGLQMQAKAGKLSTTKFVYKVSIYCNQGKTNLSVNNAYSGIEFSDGNRYCPFELKKLTHNEPVYDLTVEEDHSFSVSGVIVHNCFNSHVEDTMDSILHNVAEVGMMTKHGGGTSGYFGEIRSRGSEISSGGKSDGSIHFMQLFESVTNVCKQSSVRRGAMACYLPIDHKDIHEFLKIKQEGSPIQFLFSGVCVSDNWMESMINGDSEKRDVWAKVIKSRSEIGLPYIFFTDNVNKQAPKVYKDKGLKINSSNLCSEIMLSSTPDESFVCCLSSMNLLHYDEWKDSDAVEVMAYFLDSVLDEFIEKASKIPFMERAVRFSQNQRAIGIGATGWHSLLQSKGIPFESLNAQWLNAEIFENMNNASLEASKKAAREMGEPPLLKGYGERWTTRHAIAPNTSSAFILGQVSQSIEPFKSNYYVKDLAKFKYSVRNIYLEETLKTYNKNTEETWELILKNNGSVQNLPFLTQEEKDTFRTFGEISAKETIIQASQRQKFIDQGQSLNLTIPPKTSAKEINELLIFAWESGIKTLYYQHSTNAAQAFYRKLNECTNCEG
jgi:ribonucleoside-diphosphate reductase alpha chain